MDDETFTRIIIARSCLETGMPEETTTDTFSKAFNMSQDEAKRFYKDAVDNYRCFDGLIIRENDKHYWIPSPSSKHEINKELLASLTERQRLGIENEIKSFQKSK